MDQYHEVVKGKVIRGTGAKKVKFRDKKKAHVGGSFTATKVGQRITKKVRGRGGTYKVKVKREEYANVATPEGIKRVKILRVLESVRPDYTRQGIITKGAVIETEAGKAVVTSRPGQDGIINAKLA